jgi:aspartyl/glutamyl-tRNA(Asn/Gln) amidotransferase C subunit
MITKEEVQHIAKLARLDLSEQEIKKYQEQLGNILNYVEKLQKVDTEGIETSDGGTRDLENVWSSDEGVEKDNTELINMAPENYSGQVKVKKIL